MKKFIVLALAMVLVLGLAGMAFAGVSGSKHDLASGTYTSGIAGTNQVCVFCHHPHRGPNGGDENATNALLWNMADFSATSYTAYQQSGTLNNATSAVTGTSAPQSFLCMACHDGSIGAGALLQAPTDGTNIAATVSVANANLGSTLEDDHPVNMIYTGNDAGILTAVSGQVASTYPLFDSGGSGTNEWMQCGTCHGVHLGAGDSQSPLTDFMRGNLVGSQICRDCHTNK